MKYSILSLIASIYFSFSFGQGQIPKIEAPLINCAVHISIHQKNAIGTSTGTGFLVATRNPDSSTNQIYLVTNKHMLGVWTLATPYFPADSISVDFYPRQNVPTIVSKTFRIKNQNGTLNKNLIIHPNSKVDVAIINVTDILKSDRRIFWYVIDTAAFLRSENMVRSNISYGSQVFAIGYPNDFKISGSNLPIAKSAYISSSTKGDLQVDFRIELPTKEVKKVSPQGKFFLVDGLIIGGNSGGPVVIPSQEDFGFDNRGIFKRIINSSVIGIVSMVTPGTGIAVIYAADNILDLIIEDTKRRS